MLYLFARRAAAAEERDERIVVVGDIDDGWRVPVRERLPCAGIDENETLARPHEERADGALDHAVGPEHVLLLPRHRLLIGNGFVAGSCATIIPSITGRISMSPTFMGTDFRYSPR